MRPRRPGRSTCSPPPTSGLVLGLTIAAMFLGHWYLNTPTMALSPLERLLRLAGAAIGLRTVVAAAGLALNIGASGWPGTEQTLFLTLRWLSGLIGAAILIAMAAKTLRIPNTQSRPEFCTWRSLPRFSAS